MAVTVKVSVSAQGVPLVAELTLMVGVPQVSLAVTSALTLAQVGRVAGLQPKLLPVGTVTVGAVVLVKVMDCTQLAELPEASVAVHVREMPARPVQLTGPAASVYVTFGLGSQVSVAVAVPVLLTLVDWPHVTVTFAGQEIAGGVVSCTITSNVHEFDWPLQKSLAV